MILLKGLKKDFYKLRREHNYAIENSTKYFDDWFLRKSSKDELNYNDQVLKNKYIANEEIYNLFYPFIKDYNDKNILDIGSGTGLTGKRFIEKGFNLYGADIIDKSKHLAENLGYKKIFYLDLNNLKGSEKIKKFNLIISSGLLGEFIEPKIGLENLLTKLNCNGFACINIDETLIGESNYELINSFEKKGRIKLIKSKSKKTYKWGFLNVKYDYFLIQKLR